MKLLSVAVPCFNSAAYMDHCISTLVSGGEDMEVIIVNDGSTKDNTAEIADSWAERYPTIVKAVHQENAGHGGACMKGLANATGLYFKVVDSDDWVDEEVLRQILGKLREFSQMEKPVDLLISNFVYDKVGVEKKQSIDYRSAFPVNKIFTWDEFGHFEVGHYMLMHAMIYRREVLIKSGMVMPKHTFYVDNIYATVPLKDVETMYYLNVNFYHYFIGRDDQSVQQATMIKRIDQQIRVNKELFEQVDVASIKHPKQRKVILDYQEIITTVSSVLCLIDGSDELLAKKAELWAWLKENHPWEYKKIRYGFYGVAMNLPGKPGRDIAKWGYKVANKFVSFN